MDEGISITISLITQFVVGCGAFVAGWILFRSVRGGSGLASLIGGILILVGALGWVVLWVTYFGFGTIVLSDELDLEFYDSVSRISSGIWSIGTLIFFGSVICVAVQFRRLQRRVQELEQLHEVLAEQEGS